MLITPQQIEKAATDIVDFYENSDLPPGDKKKILEMVNSYYEDKNEHLVDQYLGALTKRTIASKFPETSFESNGKQ